jgi:alpha-tubulin suppressor-like RCC1 family protein
VFMWGRNSVGQLGDGTTTDRIVPTEITSRFSLSTGDQIISLSISSYHSSALSATGRVFMWGDNMVGQLGDATTQFNTFRILPIEITSRFSLNEGDKIISLSLNDLNSSALSATGRVFMWGLNLRANNSILGDGTMVFNRNVPTEITSSFSLAAGDKFISLSIGYGFSSALSSTGRVFMWGVNEYGQLGDGTTTHRNFPTEITPRFSLAAGDKIISVSLSDYESSALSESGRVFMWGFNGILGVGTMVFNRNVPTEITSRFSLAEGEKIISVSLGLAHSSALSSTGRLFMWGSNDYGQLGDGGTVGTNTPVVIYNVIEIT